jgi:hypothetical protein
VTSWQDLRRRDNGYAESIAVLELSLAHVYLSNASSGSSDNGLDHLVELSREGSCDAGAG